MKLHTHRHTNRFGLVVFLFIASTLALTGCGQKQVATPTPADRKATILKNIQDDPTLTPAQKAENIKRTEAALDAQAKTDAQAK